MIYLNPAGLSPFHPEVQQEISRTLDTFSRLLYAEPGIQHYRETLQQCRRTIADWLALPDEQQVAFMPNATTACSLILSRIHWKSGDILLTTTHENSTILQEINELKDRGIEVICLDPDAPTGLLPQLEQTVQSQSVRAIAVSHVSHLDGRIFPIATIQELAQSHQTLLIVDGAQAVGHIPVSFRQIRPYAYFFPGHKWCAGPMGTGALILGEHCGEPNACGTEGEGGQQDTRSYWTRYELGTQNIGLIAGFAKACNLKAQQNPNTQILDEVRDEWKGCLGQYPGIRILEWDGPHSPGILSFACLDEKTEQFIRTFASTRSIAWKTFTHPLCPSHLSVRVSWTMDTPKTDLRSVIASLKSL
jgi:selenocysteine lyase/cysteine desulfurase